MADNQFDELTRRLAGPQSRGAMLKTLLAAAVGGALLPASALAEHEDRKHNPFGPKHHPKPQSPIRHCITQGHLCHPKRHRCCSGLTCREVACKPPACPAYECLP
jgi:hypothetical protein